MTRCPKCKGIEFRVDSIVYAADYIAIDEKEQNYRTYDTKDYDSEWMDDGQVVCSNCDWTDNVKDWSARKPEVTAERK